MSTPLVEENDQTRARMEHLDALRKLVGNVYPNKFARSRVTGDEDTVTDIVTIEEITKHVPHLEEGQRPTPEQLTTANEELKKFEVRISGRIATPPRVMGKAAFVHLSDGISRLQVYIRKEEVKAIHNDGGAPVEEGWEVFQLLDHGDFIGVDGYIFVTKTGELSVHVRAFQFLSKALLPMPDKMHGISDPEIRQRQRYADLIAGSLKMEREEGELTPREVFERRSKVISELRRYLDGHGYIEVETPMLTAKATGAAARPFKTHHNALDIDLYARIAPELYLKRLVVGGFEKVYELNRNFRNEGIDRTHNPEFTMLEIYAAYMNADGMMDLCEELLRHVLEKLRAESAQVPDYNFANFRRLTMKDAIAEIWKIVYRNTDSAPPLTAEMLDDPAIVLCVEEVILELEKRPWIFGTEEIGFDNYTRSVLMAKDFTTLAKQRRPQIPSDELEENKTAKRVEYIFDYLYGEQFNDRAKHSGLFNLRIKEPVFIYGYPKVLSPLSKVSPTNTAIAERFELFIDGMECANGFSELNDPHEQRVRFEEQEAQRERGDEEAMVLDEDYIRALSYGMPPAAGIGIGIDRLVMLLTNRHSIRDVILFPHMRPE